jgi:hypothetical protein
MLVNLRKKATRILAGSPLWTHAVFQNHKGGPGLGQGNRNAKALVHVLAKVIFQAHPCPAHPGPPHPTHVLARVVGSTQGV